MATLSASIQLYDKMSAPLNSMITSMNIMLSTLSNVDSAVDSAFDAESINAARAQLQQAETAMNQIDQAIQQAANEQEDFNSKVVAGSNNMDSLVGKVTALAAGYLSIQAVGKVLDISDDLVSTTARLDMMNDGLQSTDELVQMVYASAQDARGSFSDMADVVAKFGNNAGDAFGSSEEVVQFANLIQKQMTIAGASTAEASNAMLQLSQALGSGTLRGDELNSIFEQAPNLIQSIADYMGVPIGQIREMASEGQLSADIVKQAIFASSDEINEKFNQMPMTWGQVWTSMQNTALMYFQPVLDRVNQLANNEQFQQMVNNMLNGLAQIANWLLNVMELAGQVAMFFSDNWSVIEPIVMGIVTALALYEGAMLAINVINGVAAVAEGVKAAAQAMATGATLAATAAQYGLNAALMACPITWIVLAVIALVAAIIAICQWIANATGVASTWFGVMMGGVFVVGAAFKNFGLLVANIALGIWNALGAVCENIGIAFHNVIANVQSWFYGLLATALEVVEGICEALNKLPFVEFDFSSISSAADDYAAKSAEAAGSVQEYTSVGDAFSEGMSTFEYEDYGTAFENGAAWGDGIADSVSGMFSFGEGGADASSYTGFGSGAYASELGDIAGSTAETASNTSKDVDATDEQLEYLRDIAETEAINRFTTAEISVNMTNNNNVSSDMDIDGMVSTLSAGVYEAMLAAAEGV